MKTSSGRPVEPSSRWLSKDFSDLLAQVPKRTSDHWEAPSPNGRRGDGITEDRYREVDYDLLIIGSGYGAAVAASELAGLEEDGRPYCVAVLERGLEYLPGAFPSRAADLPRRLRGHFAARDVGGEGPYDLRLGADVSVVLANGLGGGSLINAGVMEVPDPAVFRNHDNQWPKTLADPARLAPYYERASALLGATRTRATNAAPTRNTASAPAPGSAPVNGSPAGLPKYNALRILASGGGLSAEEAAITVAMHPEVTSGGVQLHPCKKCGDCATGCNYGAKESLDTNLLVQARRRGAEIFCGTTVLRIAPFEHRSLSPSPPAGPPPETEQVWQVQVVHTDEKLRDRQGDSQWVTARRVILAAGSLGSTEILMRSQQAGQASRLQFSPALGKRFSTNGDMLHFGFGYSRTVNAMADEDQPPAQRGVGPTITGLIRTTHDGRPLTIEEMAVPGPIRRLAEEMITTANSLYWLAERDTSRHREGRPDWDVIALQPEKFKATAIWAVMGDDGAGGSLKLDAGIDARRYEGRIRVVWPEAKTLPLFTAQNELIARMACESHLGGTAIANPVWQPLPPGKELFLRGKKGPLLTVHPLGGCPMGDDAHTSVVNEFGQVYRLRKREPGEDEAADWYPPSLGLVVLDGAIVPSSLCINPALTITALALRATEHLKAIWGLERDAERPGWKPGDAVLERPVYANRRPADRLSPHSPIDDVEAGVIARQGKPPARAEFLERLSGPVDLLDARGRQVKCRVELTLAYEPLPLRNLFTAVTPEGTDRKGRPRSRGRLDDARLVLARHGSVTTGTDTPRDCTLRIFLEREWQAARVEEYAKADHEAKLKEIALCSFELQPGGTLTILRRGNSTYLNRLRRALWAWWFNRGPRDFLPPFLDMRTMFKVRKGLKNAFSQLRTAGRAGLPSSKWQIWDRHVTDDDGVGAGLIDLASHAGEIRRFEYALRLGARLSIRPHLPDDLHFAPLSGGGILGRKHITYARPSNPWRQLSEMSLDQLPFPMAPGQKAVLKLDTRYLVDRETPLMRIVSQPDHYSALVDAGSMALCFLRMLLPIHDWSLRKPEIPRVRRVERLPGPLYGLPEPDIHHLTVDELRGQPVQIRLTRYRLDNYDRALPPVVLIHGYSASGTTYAHPSLKPSLVQVLAAKRRDVWVVDLRTSAGLPTAIEPWSFEQVAVADIPAAVDFVCTNTGHKKVDVLAHCMGAAMLSMAVLSASTPLRRILSPRSEVWIDEFEDWPDRYKAERRDLPQRINKLVLSQVGPLLVLSPQNNFRSFVQMFMTQLFGPLPYHFRPTHDDGLGMELLDRLFGSLSYPDEQLLEENRFVPWRRSDYIGARHRMDAIYGETFKLGNMRRDVLDHLDDFFGPLNLATVSQVGHFARQMTVTNRGGRNRFVGLDNIRKHWSFDTLYLHAQENGLSDLSTLHRMRRVFEQAGRPIETKVLEGQGHQDCLIGRRCGETFAHITKFLG